LLSSASDQRILSLLPGATETVFGLDAQDRLVGVSHECDHPPAANKLPRVTKTRVDPHLPSKQLDDDVKALGKQKESLYTLDAKLIKKLRPNLILTQVQCEVCAVTPEDLKEVVEVLDERPKIVAVDGQDLEGVLRDMRSISEALDLREAGKLLLFRQWRLVKEIRARVESLEIPRVAVIDWIDPVMFAGNWIPELARIAGGNASLVEGGKPSRWGSWEELEEFDPNVILVAACGRGIAESQKELTAALKGYRRGDLTALDDQRVFVADGHQYFNRAGPRLVYSAALMARAFHPTLPPLPPSLEEMIRPWRG
jgi:iron complex transport system substrate-binding protein